MKTRRKFLLSSAFWTAALAACFFGIAVYAGPPLQEGLSYTFDFSNSVISESSESIEVQKTSYVLSIEANSQDEYGTRCRFVLSDIAAPEDSLEGWLLQGLKLEGELELDRGGDVLVLNATSAKESTEKPDLADSSSVADERSTARKIAAYILGTFGIPTFANADLPQGIDHAESDSLISNQLYEVSRTLLRRDADTILLDEDVACFSHEQHLTSRNTIVSDLFRRNIISREQIVEQLWWNWDLAAPMLFHHNVVEHELRTLNGQLQRVRGSFIERKTRLKLRAWED